MEGKDTLYNTLATPSITSTYSIGLEYIKKWFFDKFHPGFFKTIFVNQKNPLDEYRNFTITKNLKKIKPSVAINPQINFDYDRDYVDMYQCDINDYVQRSKLLNNIFFHDNQKNLNLSTIFELLEFNFGFTIRMSTRAQQIDLYKYMMLAFRFGSTQGEDITMDCHIPYAMMMQVAQDAGFEVKDNKVVDVIGFVRYLNKHSEIPILYKYRTINAKDEFFMRVENLYVHINTIEKPSLDDGERNGQIMTNFSIEFNAILRIPAPQFYAYHSVNEPELMLNISESNADTIGLYTIKVPEIPKYNDRGWDQYIVTEYYSDEVNTEIDIDLLELFENSDIYNVYKHTVDQLLSPSIFMDIKVYQDGNYMDTTMDWRTLTVHTNIPVSKNSLIISIYADLEYMKSVIINKNNLNNRFTNKQDENRNKF